MIHPATEVRQAKPPIGVGVFATEDIPKGTVLWILDRFDRVIRPDELRSWPPEIRAVAERFGYIAQDGSWVVCWDHGRLMNHSCDPATVSVGTGLEIARRDLRHGDEVTCDYGTLNLTGVLLCRCGAPACRGEISAAQAAALCATWDAWARDACSAALEVHQPLLPFARGDGTDAAILAAMTKRCPIDLPPTHSLLRPAPPRRAEPRARLWSLE